MKIKPVRSAVYHLIHQGRVVYVGASINVYSRIAAWCTGAWFKFDEIELFPVPIDELEATERTHIEKHLPEHNSEGVERPYTGFNLQVSDEPLTALERLRNLHDKHITMTALGWCRVSASKKEALKMVERGLLPPPVSRRHRNDSNGMPIYLWDRAQVIEYLEKQAAA